MTAVDVLECDKPFAGLSRKDDLAVLLNRTDRQVISEGCIRSISPFRSNKGSGVAGQESARLPPGMFFPVLCPTRNSGENCRSAAATSWGPHASPEQPNLRERAP
jgi:hypothetical protein